MSKKQFAVSILFALMLLIVAFAPMSTQQTGSYDPWIDTNDDGIIDIYDIIALGARFGAEGTPINKTAILLDLQSRVSALEAAGSVTTDKISDGAVVTIKLADGSVTSAKILDGSITAADLADSSVVTVKIANGAVTTDKIADGAVTNSKLAYGAIPFGCTTMTNMVYYAKNWANVFPYPITITVQRPSYLWIMFSADAYLETVDYFHVKAVINSVYTASPGEYILCEYPTFWQSYSCNFYYYATASSYPATFTVEMAGRTETNMAYTSNRALGVMALPA